MAEKFFTVPNSSKKRKRTTSLAPKSKSNPKRRNDDDLDDEIPSDSDDMAEEIEADNDADSVSLDGVDSDDEDDKETAADKRRRLAKQYLENIHEEMGTFITVKLVID